MFSSRSLILVVAMPALLVLSACSNSSKDDSEAATAPHTGDVVVEAQVATEAQAPAHFQVGNQLYVSSDRLRARSTPAITDDNVAGVLEQNDKVEIVDPTEVTDQKFIGVKVVSTTTGTPKGQTIYVAEKYLSTTEVAQAPIEIPVEPGTPSPVKSTSVSPSDITVITNIATYKVRFYRKCSASESCKNKMFFETDVVAGEDQDGTRTDVGSYRVVAWNKFYETPGLYPAWYRPGYPKVPDPDTRLDWTREAFMPGGKGAMRGAFGWYTAMVSPNPHGQWFHGTAGWGVDKKSFIVFRDTFLGGLVHMFHQIDSHGCTRTDNESIAFARSHIPVGAHYLKVYAKEALRDPTRAGYTTTQEQFDYILTKRGYGSTNNEPADKATVLRDGTPSSDYLDHGTLSVDAYPKAVKYSGSGAHSGDAYGIGGGNFVGVYYVDDGSFAGYRHPSHKKIGIGGYIENGRAAEFPSQNVVSASSGTSTNLP